MSKSLRLVLASIGVLLAIGAVLLAAGQITLTYDLPTPAGHATQHTTTFGPAIAATVVAGVVALIMLGWLVGNIIVRPIRWLWLVPIGALLISFIAVAAVAGMDRPAF